MSAPFGDGKRDWDHPQTKAMAEECLRQWASVGALVEYWTCEKHLAVTVESLPTGLVRVRLANIAYASGPTVLKAFIRAYEDRRRAGLDADFAGGTLWRDTGAST